MLALAAIVAALLALAPSASAKVSSRAARPP